MGKANKFIKKRPPADKMLSDEEYDNYEKNVADRPNIMLERLWSIPNADVNANKDDNFLNSLAISMDTDAFLEKISDYGIVLETLFQKNVTERVSTKYLKRFNDFLDSEIKNGSSILSMMVMILGEHETDMRQFSALLSNSNFDLLKLELAVKYKLASKLDNAGGEFFK